MSGFGVREIIAREGPMHILLLARDAHKLIDQANTVEPEQGRAASIFEKTNRSHCGRKATVAWFVRLNVRKRTLQPLRCR